jgi:hypothetical protein
VSVTKRMDIVNEESEEGSDYEQGEYDNQDGQLDHRYSGKRYLRNMKSSPVMCRGSGVGAGNTYNSS